MGKRWEEIIVGEEYVLKYTPFSEDVTLAVLRKDDDNDWTLTSKTLREDDTYFADADEDIEEVKKMVEDAIEEYFTDEISYYEHLLKSFSE